MYEKLNKKTTVVYGSNINAHHNKVYNNNLTNFACGS